LAVVIPSHGVNLNALLFSAAGAGPHPTVLLRHGLPGNEQNLDLAQSMRRAGWNVLTLHYRGSWGTPGSFSFANCLQDAAAAMAWLRNPGASRDRKIDARRLVVVGHSMGAFIAAHVASSDPEVLAACLISGVDLGSAFGSPSPTVGAAAVDDNVGFSDGLHILSGTSAAALAAEAGNRASSWRLDSHAAKLADRPLLLVTSDDGFAAGSDALGRAVEAIGSDKLSQTHFATDHSYSDHRIALQVEILNWLAAVARSPSW
jgi:pimeloyl-ACP methyl ester carboxylesterase